MNRNILKPGLALVLTCLMAGSGATAAGTATADGLEDASLRQKYPFVAMKLKAGGQIHAESGLVTFAGQASHLGQFTAVAQTNPWGFEGTMTAASGDAADFYAFFQVGESGERTAYVRFVSGSGRFFDVYGETEGPATLDDDGMFTMSVEGRVHFYPR